MQPCRSTEGGVRRTVLAFLAAFLLFLPGSRVDAADEADPFLHLKPLIGKTFRAMREDRGPNAAQATSGDDVMRWEWAIRGKAVRVVHAFEDGSYGGETLIHFDRDRRELVYRYVTTAGFYTQGVMRTEAGRLICEESVVGLEKIATVKAVYLLGADGTVRTTAEYVNEDGTTSPGRRSVYREDAGARVNLPPDPG